MRTGEGDDAVYGVPGQLSPELSLNRRDIAGRFIPDAFAGVVAAGGARISPLTTPRALPRTAEVSRALA